MTGFGQSEVSSQGFRVSVEIRTVNHRFLDFSVKLPRGLANREREVKEVIRTRITRGRISVSIATESDKPDHVVSINLPVMEQYVDALTRFAKDHNIAGELNINTLATLPDVFEKEEDGDHSDVLWPLVEMGIEQALEECMSMRTEEGKALEADIRGRLEAIAALIVEIESLAPGAMESSKKALLERLQKIMDGTTVNHERWMTEVAIIADRVDFTEEITRLKSHVAQFNNCLDENGAISKKLTYLLQEIHRESTTIGSKASSAAIIENVVSLKEESEKLREQVQNIE